MPIVRPFGGLLDSQPGNGAFQTCALSGIAFSSELHPDGRSAAYSPGHAVEESARPAHSDNWQWADRTPLAQSQRRRGGFVTDRSREVSSALGLWGSCLTRDKARSSVPVFIGPGFNGPVFIGPVFIGQGPRSDPAGSVQTTKQ